MGSTTSTEQLMAKAIENYDIGEVKVLMKDLTTEQKHGICKALVPWKCKSMFNTSLCRMARSDE